MPEIRTMTLADLKVAQSCDHDAAIFVELYGAEGNEVTYERVMQGALRFDWVRGAQILLTPKQRAYYKALMVAAFRGLHRVNDPTQEKRRTAMAFAFYKAYNSPME